MKDNLIKRFQILGLKNYRNVDITFKKSCKILVGENGLGKTTILDVFYYVLTRRWESLDEIVFDFIELELAHHIIEFSQSELNIYVCYIEKIDVYINDNVISKFEEINRILIEEFEDRIIYLPIYRNLHEQLAPLLDFRYRTDFYSILNRRNFFNKERRGIFRDTVMEADMSDIEERLILYKESESLEKFRETCNNYLEETRFIRSDENGLVVININNNEAVKLKYLSSGEKQIINIFSKFYLSERDNLILLIDEPELSLSLNWQKKLLPDIIASKNCDFLFAITHSPFIFDNELKNYAEGLDIYINTQPNA